MIPANSITISEPLRTPVRVITVDGLPKIIAGGVPVTPFNAALGRRRTTKEGLDPYTRASRLYCEFCAHLQRSIVDISNDEFYRYEDALLGRGFHDASGNWVRLSGERERGERTADLMLSCIYTIAKDIEGLYGVKFDWRRYSGLPTEVLELAQAMRPSGRLISQARTHSISWTERKVPALPDDQFIKMLQGARKLWGTTIMDGDRAYAPEPETQRGALFIRNVGILFCLRYEGSRRVEVTLIRMSDIDRANSKLYLVTKGHGGEFGTRLPVVLFPQVDAIVWHYVMKFRPDTTNYSERDQQHVFVSHSVRNYGQSISAQTVRKLIDALKPFLDPPWKGIVTPHMLRKSFSHHLQGLGGDAATTANMRHSSNSSGGPYSAPIETFMDKMVGPINKDIEEVIEQAGISEIISQKHE
jgi:integrase